MFWTPIAADKPIHWLAAAFVTYMKSDCKRVIQTVGREHSSTIAVTADTAQDDDDPREEEEDEQSAHPERTASYNKR